MKTRLFFARFSLSLFTFALAIFLSAMGQAAHSDDQRIQPYKTNPRYWQYQGAPVLLVGGSEDDNLFQIPYLEAHLDTMKAVGANYIRCTMSGRNDRGFEVYPYAKNDDGLYDLDQWNEEYWTRFQTLLRLTQERDIIVQVEAWAFHDFNEKAWAENPWNPSANINYSENDVALLSEPSNIAQQTHSFFYSVPKLSRNPALLKRQERFVEKILSETLDYGHVLYCVTNEIHDNYSPEWGWHWSDFMRAAAKGKNKEIEITEMYWQTDLTHRQHKASLIRKDLFDYFEASQNSAKSGEENWGNLQAIYSGVARALRPINNVKIYGSDEFGSWTTSSQEAQERFWRNMIGGSASSRFHRPPYGLGLSPLAQANIKSFRMLESKFDFFTSRPDGKHRRLSNREENEAYLHFTPGKQYAIYFPNGGEVELDLNEMSGAGSLQWLNILESRWSEASSIEGGNAVSINAPEGGAPYIALILEQLTE